jgi:hypothetical protein
MPIIVMAVIIAAAYGINALSAPSTASAQRWPSRGADCPRRGDPEAVPRVGGRPRQCSPVADLDGAGWEAMPAFVS